MNLMKFSSCLPVSFTTDCRIHHFALVIGYFINGSLVLGGVRNRPIRPTIGIGIGIRPYCGYVSLISKVCNMSNVNTHIVLYRFASSSKDDDLI